MTWLIGEHDLRIIEKNMAKFNKVRVGEKKMIEKEEKRKE